MPSFPLHAGQRNEAVGATTATSKGTTTTSGAANTKSASWTQLIASTAFEASRIAILFDTPVANRDHLIDIAIGGAGSEVVLLSNLYFCSGNGSLTFGAMYTFPIKIPAGSRLSVKNQCSTTTNALGISCQLFSQGFLPGQPLSLVTTYGANTADSGGVSVDPGASANTKGSYSEIVASTTYPIFSLSFAIGNLLNNVRTSCNWLIDMAIGAGGSEQVIIPNLSLFCSTTPDVIVPQMFNLFPVNIPAGTRLAVRAQCSITDATDRLFDFVAYGVT